MVSRTGLAMYIVYLAFAHVSKKSVDSRGIKIVQLLLLICPSSPLPHMI